MLGGRIWCVVALLLVGATACRRPDGPTIEFRLETDDGHAASAQDMATSLAVLEARLVAAGFEELEIALLDDGRVTVTLPKARVKDEVAVTALAERRGTLEFRIRAPRDEEDKWRELRDAGEGADPTPTAFQWVPVRTRPYSDPGRPDMLVQTPERPLQLAMEDVGKRIGRESPEFRAAKAAYDDAAAAEVFTSAQLARAHVQQHSFAGSVVYFEFEDVRKPYFERFTEKHIQEPMAIIVDGQVESAPHIASKLPGEAVIEGGNPSFTETEAKALAAVISSGSMPGRLVRVAAPEAK